MTRRGGHGRSVAVGQSVTSVLLADWLRFLVLLCFFLRSSVEVAGLELVLSALAGSAAFFSGSKATGVGGSSSSGGSGNGSR